MQVDVAFGGQVCITPMFHDFPAPVPMIGLIAHSEKPAAASVVAALKDIGFAGYLSGEILPLPDSEAAAAQTIKAIRTHLPR